MICSQGRLADGKGLFEQIAGLGEPILISHIHTKVVEAGGTIMALFAKFSFHQSEDFSFTATASSPFAKRQVMRAWDSKWSVVSCRAAARL